MGLFKTLRRAANLAKAIPATAKIAKSTAGFSKDMATGNFANLPSRFGEVGSAIKGSGIKEAAGSDTSRFGGARSLSAPDKDAKPETEEEKKRRARMEAMSKLQNQRRLSPGRSQVMNKSRTINVRSLANKTSLTGS